MSCNGIINGHDLGMGSAGFRVKPLTNDPAVLYHYRTHTRIGRGKAFTPGRKV
jgi:hypothetical protein